jgi:hypothetical protein
MGEKTKVDERPKERKNQSTGVDVLSDMLVTAAVSHLERSALNADARKNAVEVNAVVDPIEKEKWKKNEEKRKWVRKEKSMKDPRNGRTKELE